MWELGLEVARVGLGTMFGVMAIVLAVHTFRIVKNPEVYEKNRQRHLQRIKLIKILQS